jgi:Zn-dependent M28 family amino/carboxypeptidase
LLAASGHSLEQVRQVSDSLQAGEAASFETDTQVSMSVAAVQPEDLTSENYYAVLGVIPGADAESGLDAQVIIVSAYYDGLGVGPDGVFYPGANDNASGVAMMLELARLLKQSSYKPDKTIVFVAWPGGERGDGLSVTALMNLRTGFNKLGVEAVIELSGVGAGTGKGAALGEDSSYRLVKLFQEAAGKMGLQVTTRGRGPHYGADIPPVFGGRKSMTLSVCWDGSDDLAHTTQDTIERIDPRKVKSLGRTVYLTLLVLSRETEY